MGYANDNAYKTAKDALDFRADETTSALEFARKAQEDTNNLIRYTNEAFTSKLANNAGDAPQNTVDNIVKYVTIAGTIFGIVALFKNKKAA